MIAGLPKNNDIERFRELPPTPILPLIRIFNPRTPHWENIGASCSEIKENKNKKNFLWSQITRDFRILLINGSNISKFLLRNAKYAKSINSLRKKIVENEFLKNLSLCLIPNKYTFSQKVSRV